MLRATVLTRRGDRRGANQDRVVVDNTVVASEHRSVAMFDLEPPCLVAVLDGLGGHPAGDIASAVAADVIASGSSGVGTEADVAGLVERANRHLYRTMFTYPSLEGMGTTVAGVFFASDSTTVFHVGDSRVYSYTDGHMTRATTDDADPHSGLITQVLGGSRWFTPVVVHLSTEPMKTGRMLMATDGLFGLADHDALSEAMDGSLDNVPDRLQKVAIESGNSDDFSVAVVETNLEDRRVTGDNPQRQQPG